MRWSVWWASLVFRGRVDGGLIWLSHTRAIQPGFSNGQYTPRLRLRRLLRVRWAVLSESTGEVRDRWLVEEQGGGTRRPGDTNNPLYQHRGEPCRPDRGLSA